MAELIRKTDTLNQGREKLNAAIADANNAKRCTVILSSTANYPNIDLTQRKIIFSSLFSIIVGSSRYLINSAEIDFSSIITGSFGVVVFFDTTQQIFIVKSHTNIGTIPESCVFFCALTFYNGNPWLRAVDFPCDYKINGILQNDDHEEKLLKEDNLRGVTSTVIFHASGALDKIIYKNSASVIIRTDTFSTSGNILTETRRLPSGRTLIKKYNLDTLETEVVT